MRFRDFRALRDALPEVAPPNGLIDATLADLDLQCVKTQVGLIGERGAMQVVAGLLAFAAWAGHKGYPGRRLMARHPGTNRRMRRVLAKRSTTVTLDESYARDRDSSGEDVGHRPTDG